MKHTRAGKTLLNEGFGSAAVTSSAVVSVRREREEDHREIIYQVHSRREARHQNWQIRGQDTGKLLLLIPVTGMIQRGA